MPHFLVGANVAGEGLRERLRSTTFAFFGLVTATGLVLVGIAVQPGLARLRQQPDSGHTDPAGGRGQDRRGRGQKDRGRRPRHRLAPIRACRQGPARSRPVFGSPRHLPARGARGGVGWPGPRLGSVGARWGGRAGASRSGAGRSAPPGRRPAAGRPGPSRTVARTRPGAGEGNSPGRCLAPDLKGRSPGPREWQSERPRKEPRHLDGAGARGPKGAESAGGGARATRSQAPAAPTEPAAPAKEAPPPAGEQPGKGHAYGHYK